MNKILLILTLFIIASCVYSQCIIENNTLVSYAFNPNEIYLLEHNIDFLQGNHNILTIGEKCFANKRCKEITLPFFAIYFQERFIENTPNLKYIILDKYVQGIDDNAFTGSSLEYIALSDLKNKEVELFFNEWLAYKMGYGKTNEVDKGLMLFGYFGDLSKTITLSEVNNLIQIKYKSYDGVLYSRDYKLVCYPPMKKGDEYKIPKNCIKLGSAAFNNCKYLKKLYIPSSLGNFTKNTFKGSDNLVLVVYENSPAHKLCEKLQLKYEIRKNGK